MITKIKKWFIDLPLKRRVILSIALIIVIVILFT